MTVTLAPATPADADDIATLAAEMDVFYGDVRPDTPQQRVADISAALFADPLAYMLLARDEDGTLAGFASYSFLWPAAGLTASLYLKELYIAAAARRQGIGELLMRGLYRIAAERGCSRVEWTTDQDNAGAQEFYEVLGAKPAPGKIFYRVGGEDLTAQAGPVSLPVRVPNMPLVPLPSCSGGGTVISGIRVPGSRSRSGILRQRRPAPARLARREHQTPACTRLRGRPVRRRRVQFREQRERPCLCVLEHRVGRSLRQRPATHRQRQPGECRTGQ